MLIFIIINNIINWTPKLKLKMQPGNPMNDPRFNMRNKCSMNYLMQLQERKSHKAKLTRINESKAISKGIMTQ